MTMTAKQAQILQLIADAQTRKAAVEQQRKTRKTIARWGVVAFFLFCLVYGFASSKTDTGTAAAPTAMAAPANDVAPAVAAEPAKPAPTPMPTPTPTKTEPTAAEKAEKEADNRYDGCMKLQIATDASYREADCTPAKIAKFLASAKGKNADRVYDFCFMAGGRTYNKNNKRHDKKQLPDDVARDIFTCPCSNFHKPEKCW